MQKIKEIYRSNYSGENIVTELTYEKGEWAPVTEHIPNVVFNTHTTSQAIAIGNGQSRLGFDLKFIANHKGGLLAVDKLQSYGCNGLYRDFAPDFLVAVGSAIIEEIANSGYTTDNIVYTNAQYLSKYPGKFYIVPQNPTLDAGALALYLACFDGHTKIYLMGYDGNQGLEPVNNVYKDTAGYPASTIMENNTLFWSKSLINVMTAYPMVDFVRVAPNANYWMDSELAKLPNLRQIDFRQFVLEADIG